jgi:hypothetical protein
MHQSDESVITCSPTSMSEISCRRLKGHKLHAVLNVDHSLVCGTAILDHLNNYFIGRVLFFLFLYLDGETYKTMREDDCHCHVSHITPYISLIHQNHMNATGNQYQHAIHYVSNAGLDKSWTPGYL